MPHAINLPAVVHRAAQREIRREKRRAYWRRFFTSWSTDDPEPTYSELDRKDGLGPGLGVA